MAPENGADIEALFAALGDAQKEALLDSLDDADAHRFSLTSASCGFPRKSASYSSLLKNSAAGSKKSAGEIQNKADEAAQNYGGTQEEKDMLRNGVNYFAYGLYGRLDSGENVFFSPYSLCSALSLLNLGTGSQTKKELEALLQKTVSHASPFFFIKNLPSVRSSRPMDSSFYLGYG